MVQSQHYHQEENISTVTTTLEQRQMYAKRRDRTPSLFPDQILNPIHFLIPCLLADVLPTIADSAGYSDKD